MSSLDAIKALQGSWWLTYYEIAGLAVALSKQRIELKENQFTVYQNDKPTYEGKYTVGALGKDEYEPSEIVLHYSKSANPLFLGGPRPGLFQVYNDTLKWNFGAVGHSAPRSLNTHPGSESALSVYVREGAKLDDPERRISTFRSVACW